jgi:hypothetical protein
LPHGADKIAVSNKELVHGAAAQCCCQILAKAEN